jgi:hypothetical protein
MWDRLQRAFLHSVTILWARIVALTGILLVAAQQMLADPNINGAVQSLLSPKLVPFYIIAIGIVTEIARRRTAGKTTASDRG